TAKSAGVTVTALAFTLTWNRRVILAECDPAGGDIAAGYLREVNLDGRGLGRLTASLARRRLAEDLWTQMVDLAPAERTAMTRLMLPVTCDGFGDGTCATIATWQHGERVEIAR